MCGETSQSSEHLSTETAFSVLPAIFLSLSFFSSKLTGVRNSLSEFCVQHCFKCSTNCGAEISWCPQTIRVS